MADESGASEVEATNFAWLDEHVELDLTQNGRAEASGDVGGAPIAGETSERASELANDHWRERAVIWRERAIAAELVAKLLQRSVDDLRANLEDLRREAKAVATAQQLEEVSHGTGLELSPWRRFARDMYDKYLR